MDEAGREAGPDGGLQGGGGAGGAIQEPAIISRGGGPQKALAREWAYVRVIRAGEEQPPNTAGLSRDTSRCLFCGIVRTAQVNRIRDHIGGVKGAIHSKPCGGPKRLDTDTEASFSRRVAQFQAARADCSNRAKEKRAAIEEQQQEDLLDARTAGAGAHACAFAITQIIDLHHSLNHFQTDLCVQVCTASNVDSPPTHHVTQAMDYTFKASGLNIFCCNPLCKSRGQTSSRRRMFIWHVHFM
jgi:hypothetical protein